MSQPRQVFSNTITLTVANLIYRFSNIIITLIMARTLQATGVGIYATTIAYFGLINTATNMGASTFLTREIAKEPDKTNRFIMNFSVLGMIFAAVSLLIFWPLLPYFGYSPDLTTSMYIIVLAIIPGTLNTVQYSVCVAHQQTKFITYTNFLNAVLNISISSYLLLSGYGVVSIVVTLVALQYLNSMVIFYFINKHITILKWDFEWSFAINMLKEIKTFAALSILGAFYAHPEIIILSWFASDEQVGYYSAAFKIIGLWFFIPDVYMTNVYPVLSRSFYSGDQKFQFIQDKSIKYLLATSLPLAVGLMVTAKPIVDILFGPGFEQSVLPLQIAAWSIPVAFLSGVLWRALAARDKQDLVLRARIIALVIRWGSGILLIASFTAVGAAFSFPLNLLINVALLGYYVKQIGIHLPVLTLGWRFALASVAMGAFTWLLSTQLYLWFLLPLAGLSYIGFVLLFRAFSSDDWDLFRKIWQPLVAGRGS